MNTHEHTHTARVALAGGPLSAERTYRLELQSSAEGPSAFFNHLLVQPSFSVVVLANTKRKQVGHASVHAIHPADVLFLSWFTPKR